MNFDERGTVATQFGVANEQVERNHRISHLLAFLSRQFGDPIHFIGGTALARTHLPVAVSARTSISSRWATASKLRKTWTLRPRAVARSHGRLTVEPELITTADTVPVLLRPADGRPVRLQLLSPRDRILWPTERRALVQRYADDPPAELLAPTLTAFAASKTVTWADRHAACIGGRGALGRRTRRPVCFIPRGTRVLVLPRMVLSSVVVMPRGVAEAPYDGAHGRK